MNMNIRAPSSMILFIAVSLVYINYKIVERFRPFYQNLRKFNTCHPPQPKLKGPSGFFSFSTLFCLHRAPVCITSYDKQKPYRKRVKIGYMYLLMSWLLINVDKFNIIRFDSSNWAERLKYFSKFENLDRFNRILPPKL